MEELHAAMASPSNTGHPLERRIAAVHQQSGFFVERNHWATSALNVELDVVATRYGESGGLDRLIVEGTRSKDKIARKVRQLGGDILYLGYERGLFVTLKEIGDPLRQLVSGSPVHLMQVERDGEVGDALVAAGLCHRADPMLTDAWVQTYEVIDSMRRAVEASAADEDAVGIMVKQRLRAIEADLWMQPDLIARLRRLEELDWRKRLTQVAASQWAKPEWGVYQYRGLNALNDVEELRVNGVAYVQWLERINYAKAVVDAAVAARGDAALLAEMRSIARNEPHLRFPKLVRTAAKGMAVARYIPSVLQAFFLGLGGFYSEHWENEELEWVGEQAGCSREIAERALDTFMDLVPYDNNWWRPKVPRLRPLKWFPMPLHGAGVIMRDEAVHLGRRWVGKGAEWQVEQWRKAAEHARKKLCDPKAELPKRAIARRSPAGRIAS